MNSRIHMLIIINFTQMSNRINDDRVYPKGQWWTCVLHKLIFSHSMP